MEWQTVVLVGIGAFVLVSAVGFFIFYKMWKKAMG